MLAGPVLPLLGRRERDLNIHDMQNIRARKFSAVHLHSLSLAPPLVPGVLSPCGLVFPMVEAVIGQDTQGEWPSRCPVFPWGRYHG